MTLAQDADRAQRRAADPALSAWVSASAGSGKTKVLTDRVLNLLLAGASPQRLLCLTFTKAAAAEMANRVNLRLSRWAVMDEAALRAEITGLSGRPADADACTTARRLFARVLDTPGGMRFLTIHGFCQSILRRFPLEAGIIPNFEVADDRSAGELQAEARNAILAEAHARPEAALAAALAEITERVEENGFGELLAALLQQRSALQAAIEGAGGIAGYVTRLWRRFGLAVGTRVDDCLAAAAAETAFDGERLRKAAPCLLGSEKTSDHGIGIALADWLAALPEQRVAGWDTYAAAFLTGTGEIRKRLVTAGVAKANPWILDALQQEAERIVGVQKLCAHATAAAAAAAVARFGAAFIERYEIEKRQRGLLDYDDLIQRTRQLLDRPGIAPWVLFKLDGGIDHLLIDEAQDTNPDQWRVIKALTAEFFAGAGARGPARTVFAVGDPKQSIYSFQGAEPERFLAVGREFRARAEIIDHDFAEIPLAVSFRSSPAVLDVVDAVFAHAPEGVGFGGPPIRHQAHRDTAAGRVELWPLTQPEQEDEPLAWNPAPAQKFADAPRARLAVEIAETIRSWLDTRQPLGSRGRAVRAGDVMVLVRRRNAFVRDLIGALKARDVPVAGADRIVLTEQLAVMDLIALGRFLLLPEDDLNLAALLKSPLLEIDEDRLFALCHGRGGATVWSRLRDAAGSDPACAHAAETLSALLARADFVSPHALFAEVLGAGGGRRRLIGRLGLEAADAIDEFLTQTLAYERVHVPSLQGFLHWLAQSDSDIKRDLDQEDRDEVRILTVHGSKGLQAPIVFLPDTASAPGRTPPLLWDEGGECLLWAIGTAKSAKPVVEARERAEEARDREYRRLLYVALTRAEDRLYVCGWRGKRTPSSGNWHELIDSGMQGLGAITAERDAAIDGVPGEAFVYASGIATDVDPATATRVIAAAATVADFMRRPPPREPLPPRPLAALRPAEAEPASRSPLVPDDDARRYRRGIVIHRLLQTLPDLPAAERKAAARRYLARPGLALDAEQQRETLAETLAVLEHPEFQALFGPGSLAEVPVVGLVDEHALSGRIDRLLVTEREVIVVDYKTNRPPSRQLAEVPPAYLAQLQAYRRALAQIYPDKTVLTLLLWTVGPFVLEVP
jgi:ATP-dependent helicase/nuclease subunit A